MHSREVDFVDDFENTKMISWRGKSPPKQSGFFALTLALALAFFVDMQFFIFSNCQSANWPDVVGCCAARGVSFECQVKLCNLSDVPVDPTGKKEVVDCAVEYFETALTCYTDKRDHSSCCKARHVLDQCMPYCSLKNVTPVLECYEQFTDIIDCWQENYDIIPGHPVNIQVYNTSSFSAVLTWDMPLELGDTVTSYSLYVGQLVDGFDLPSVLRENVTSPYLLSGLVASSQYQFYLIAHNNRGKSLPSETTLFRTESMEPFGNDTVAMVPVLSSDILTESGREEAGVAAFIGHNVTACCISKNISGDCFHLCNHSAVASDIRQSRKKCQGQMDDLFECWADGRNHYPCCERRYMPIRCARICQGELIHLLNKVRCNNYSEVILQCLKEGLDILPSRPINFTVSDSNETSVTVKWDPPLTSPGNITGYTVYVYVPALGRANSTKNVTVSSDVSRYTFANLEKGKQYSFSVQTWNSYGSSIPSYDVRAWTFSNTISSLSDVPSPRNIEMTSANLTSLDVAWIPPKNMSPDKYRLYYKAVNADNNYASPAFTMLELPGNYTNFTIKVLEVDTKYEIFITSVKNGTESTKQGEHIFPRTVAPSFPSASITIKKRGEVKTRSEYYSNILTVPEGTHVTFTCKGRGFPKPNVSWIIGNKSIVTGFEVVAVPIVVRRQDTGKAKCIANNGVPPEAVQLLAVRVIFGPEIKPVETQLLKKLGDSATLQCSVESYPLPPNNGAGAIIWEHQLRYGPQSTEWAPILEDGRRYMAVRKTDLAYRLHFVLRIKSMFDTDFGMYRCRLADKENVTSGLIYVYNSDPMPAKAVTDISHCCAAKGVSELCINACNYEWQHPEDLTPEILKKCIISEDDTDLEKMLVCGADGHNHEPCCAAKNIPDICLPLCRGVLPPYTPELMSCLLWISTIVTCMKEGSWTLPGPPRNVYGKPVLDNSVWLHWDLPEKNFETVEYYQIIYRKVGSKNFTRIHQKVYGYSKQINGLEPNTAFEFMVEAINDVGSSLPSDAIVLRTSSIAIPDKPSGRKQEQYRKTELAVGLVVAIVILTAAVIVAVYFIRKRQTPKSPLPPITFENPGYNETGNPDETQGNNPTLQTSGTRDDGWHHPALVGTGDKALILENQFSPSATGETVPNGKHDDQGINDVTATYA